MEEFKKIKTLYVISNSIVHKQKSLEKVYSSNNSEANEDVELLLRNLMSNQEIEEHKYFDEIQEDEYESLKALRSKRMRESLESPMFGSKIDSYQSQKQMGLLRGITITSKDELEQAVSTKHLSAIFQKQKRHFSFNESENSSFPSSYNSYKRQESMNSKGTHDSNKTSNFMTIK